MVIPFGLINIPATFQVFINNVVRKYLDIFIIMYLDNILIYSQTETEYIKYVGQVLQALQDLYLQVKLKKIIFYIYKVEYLEYINLNKGVKMDPNKVYVIKK